MDVCAKCEKDLLPVTDTFYRCSDCGWENDARKPLFACADEEARRQCEWCPERLCALAERQ